MANKTLIINRLKIARQAKELQEIDKFKREFIANITHELKTPLSIVLGNADLVLEEATDEKLRGGIDVIRRAAFQLANHVDRIIMVSNIDDPDARPDLGNYDYTGLVQNVFSLFEDRARTESISYSLKIDYSKAIVVNIDAVRIEEVLNNLIQNAFKYSGPSGIIQVTVSTDGINVFTEVSDTGVGIAEDKMDRIFERMYQADNVLSRRHGGMGLGLYICKKNVEIHGGEISVHSRQGKGSTFKFSLPLHIDQNAEIQNQPFEGEDRRLKSRRRGAERRSIADRRAEERRKKFEYQQRMGIDELAKMTFSENVREYENQNPAKRTVLILEDNPGMMKVIVETLCDDYNLLLAFDAYEGMRKLKAGKDSVMLILTDIMMPGMSGFDFCEEIMKNEEYKHIPLIFISALMSQDDQIRGFNIGATDYIIKPYNIKILREKVDHWISRRQYEMIMRDASGALEERVETLHRIKDIILHEIRNPLQIIAGASYFIERLRKMQYDSASEQDKKIWDNVMALQSGTQALTAVLDATKQLDMSELADRHPETLSDLLGEAIELTKHLRGTIEFQADLEIMDDFEINCDRRLMIQVLVNIIRNAIEAVKEKNLVNGGRIEFNAARSGKRFVELNIIDNGVGMEQEQAERLFKFKYTTKKDGTGIGLHLSRMILKMHEGNVSVKSKKGEGTTFIISLPVYEYQDEPQVLNQAVQ